MHYSVAERADELFCALKLENNFQSSILGFLSLWRNLIAHMGNVQERKLDKTIKDTLLSKENYIHDKYAHLSIKEAIENYNSQNKPSSKEATFFLAITNNICREIDEAIIHQVANTEEKMISVTEKLITEYFDHNLSNRISPLTEISNIWQGSTEKRKSNLIKIFQQAGLSQIENKKKSTRKKNISCALPDWYNDEISSLSRDDIIEKFRVSKNEESQ